MKRTIIGIAAGLVLGATTVAVASIPSADGTITACVKSDGSVRLIDTEAAQNCKANEQPVTWNQTGPQGPAGTNGTNGTNGIAGYEVVSGTVVIVGPRPGGNVSGTISCPSGKVALGGGASSDVVSDQPAADGTGWTYVFTIPTLGENSQYHFHSDITCATVN